MATEKAIEKPVTLYRQQQIIANHCHGRGPLGFVGGVASGKSVGGSAYSIGNIFYYPQTPGLIFANTNKQLTQATLHRFMSVMAGPPRYWVKGVHYIFDKNPEPYFGYPSLFPDHAGIWSFANGAQVQTFSLESAIRGIEVGWAWGDEVQDADEQELEIVLARLRGGDRPRVLYTMTPPRRNVFIDQMIFGENAIPKVTATTYDNRANLPEGYIEMLEQMYDPLTFQREVMGERVETAGKVYAYSFSKDKHVSSVATYKPNRPLILIFDFNVDPFVCLAVQHGRKPDGAYFIHVVGEISLAESNIYKICEFIRVKFGESVMNRSIEISGDPTGRNRNIYDSKNRNAFQIILDELRLGKGYLNIPKITRNVDDQVLFNSILERHPEFLISPECKNFIRDLQFVRVDNYGEIIKRNRKDETQQADLLDAGKYYFQAYHADFIRRKAYAKPEPVIPLPVHHSLKDLNLS